MHPLGGTKIFICLWRWKRRKRSVDIRILSIVFGEGGRYFVAKEKSPKKETKKQPKKDKK
jgi:hypothetical protein